MEWLELLKMLSDEQTNESLQQQINVLAEQIDKIFNCLLISHAYSVAVVCLLGGASIYLAIRDERTRKRLKLAEDKLAKLVPLVEKATGTTIL